MHQDRSTPLILHIFPTFAVGGAQVRFAAIANRLGQSWRHSVISMDGDLACRERLSLSLDIDFPTVTVTKGDTLGNVRRFRDVLRTLRPHALVTSNWGTIEWLLANTPTLVPHVHTEDGLGPDERDGQLRRRVWARQLLLRRSTVVVPSRKLAALASETWSISPRRLAYIPNGVDLSRFPVRENRLERWPTRRPVIGTVAALRPEKNIERLLRAFARLAVETDARLIIVGDGVERYRLEELARRMDLASRVEFVGHVAEPSSLYASFDVFALTSDTEQMPFSVLEAMAAGLPVVATDVGDVRAMVASENDRLVVGFSDFELFDGMRFLIGNPFVAMRIGNANRVKVAAEYNSEQMFASHARLWSRVIASTSPFSNEMI